MVGSVLVVEDERARRPKWRAAGLTVHADLAPGVTFSATWAGYTNLLDASRTHLATFGNWLGE